MKITFGGFFRITPATIMRCGPTFRLARTRPTHARSSGLETSLRSRSLADYTIDTHESEFSEATAPAACTVPGFPVLAGSVGGLVVGARPTVQRTRRFSSQSAESFAIPIERGGLSLKSRDVFLLPVWVSAHYVPLSPDLDRLAASVISPLGWAIHPTCA